MLTLHSIQLIRYVGWAPLNEDELLARPDRPLDGTGRNSDWENTPEPCDAVARTKQIRQTEQL